MFRRKPMITIANHITSTYQADNVPDNFTYLSNDNLKSTCNNRNVVQHKSSNLKPCWQACTHLAVPESAVYTTAWNKPSKVQRIDIKQLRNIQGFLFLWKRFLREPCDLRLDWKGCVLPVAARVENGSQEASCLQNSVWERAQGLCKGEVFMGHRYYS